MEKERLAILKAELKAQKVEIERIYDRLDERKQEKGKAAVESMGYQLHNLYCAFEDMFKIVAETFENNIQDKSRFHIELLKRMTISIEGIRPYLLSQECFLLLSNLRSFRHFFRHAYTYEMDGRKMMIVMEDAIKLRAIYQRDVDSFLESLVWSDSKFN